MATNMSVSEGAPEFDDPLSNYDPIEYDSELHRALAEETVDAVEARPFIQVDSATTIEEAIDALDAFKAASLLVISDGKLVGIITERDILEKVAERYSVLAGTAVGAVMTENPTVVYETDPVAIALDAIAVAGHRHVPVLAIDGTPRGIVSPQRLFDFIEEHFSE